MGSDTRERNELDHAILARADCVVADSVEQYRVRGEIFHSLEAGLLEASATSSGSQRLARYGIAADQRSQITVADLTASRSRTSRSRRRCPKS